MMARMASVFIVSALLTCCCLVSCTDPACDDYAQKGGNHTLTLTFKHDPSGRLKWTHNKKVIFHQRSKAINPGRKEDVSADGSLELRNVGEEHAGNYMAEAHNNDGKPLGTLGPMRLCVLDPVKQPRVTMTCKSKEVTFNCSDKGQDGKVEWSQNGKVIKETSQSVTRVAEKVQKDKFACKVSNRVSNSISVAVIQTCYKPAIALPEHIWGINTWIVIGGGGGIVLLLLIIVIVCCVRAKRRKRMHIKDEEELRLGWTNPNQQQQQHHHHHHPPNQRHHHHQHHEHQQHQHQHRHQPAGHTGPRPHRPKQQRNKKQPDQYTSQPQPSPRRHAQAPQPANEEKPPPLPQPRKKASKPPQM